MLRASKAISLFLVGSATALAGYEAIAPNNPYAQDDYGPTTRPSGYHGTGYSHSYFGRSFFGSHYGSSSGSYGSFSSHSGTSRGGFGSSGHAAGS
jgi:hypothetical protein